MEVIARCREQLREWETAVCVRIVAKRHALSIGHRTSETSMVQLVIAGDDERVLYHYTTAAGLSGIVHDRRPLGRDAVDPGRRYAFHNPLVFHATDVRYMNDVNELRYAGAIYADVIAERLDEFDNRALHLMQTAINDLRSTAAAYGASLRVCAVCFCEDGDLLSQWRGYGGGVGGYAIGMRERMLRWGSKALYPRWHEQFLAEMPGVPLHQVVYDEAQCRADAERLVASFVEHAPSGRDVLQSPMWSLVSNAAPYKAEGFSEEREWRLVFQTAPRDGRYSFPTEFRVRSDGVVPYIPIAVGVSLISTASPHISSYEQIISDLVVGPGPDQDLRVDAAAAFLEANGHDPRVVRPSRIAFRG
jgi:hypothetical protein